MFLIDETILNCEYLKPLSKVAKELPCTISINADTEDFVFSFFEYEKIEFIESKIFSNRATNNTRTNQEICF